MNTKLQLEVEVDASGAIKGLQVVQQSVKAVTDESKRLGTEHGFEKFAEGVKQFIEAPLQSAGAGAKQLLSTLGPVGAGVAALAGTLATMAAVGFESAKSLAEYGENLTNIGIRLGLSVGQVKEFSFAMKASGGDIGQLEASMRKLSQGLNDGSTEGKKARDAMRELGISTLTASGAARPMSDIFLQLSERLNGVTDTAKRNALAVEILGRSGLEALPHILELSEGVKDFQKLGMPAPTDADLKRWKGYEQQINAIEAQWDSLKRKVKEPLAAVVMVSLKWANENPGMAGSLAMTAGLSAVSGGALAGFASQPQTMSPETRAWAAKQLASAPGFQLPGAPSLSIQSPTSNPEQLALSRYLAGGHEGLTDQMERVKAQLDAARNRGNALVSTEGLESGPAKAELENIRSLTGQYERLKKLVEDVGKAKVETLKFEKELFAITQTAELKPYGELGTIEARRRDKMREIQESVVSPAEKSKLVAGFDIQFGKELALEAQKTADAFRHVRLEFEDFAFRDQGKTAIAFAGEGLKQSLKDFTEEFHANEEIAGIRSGTQREGVLRQSSRAQQIAGMAATNPYQAVDAGYSQQLALAQKLYDIDMQRARDEFTWTGDANKLRVDGERAVADQRKIEQDAALDREMRMLELRKKGEEDFANTAKGFFEAGISGGGQGLANFVKSQAQGLAGSVVGNAAKELYKTGIVGLATTLPTSVTGTADSPSLIGKLLGGTMFGPKGDSAKVAADTQLSAANIQYSAAVAMASAVGVSVPGMPGGGTLGSLSGLIGGPGGTSGFAGAVKGLLGIGGGGAGVGGMDTAIATSSTGGISLAPADFGDSTRGASAGGGFNPMAAVMQRLGLDRSVNLPSGTTTLSSLAGSAMQIGGGTLELMNGLSTGGARGGLTAVGGAAGIVGGILPLISKSLSIAGPIGMAIAAAMPIVAALMPDPHQARAAAETRTLRNATFYAPMSMNESMGTGGGYSDFDRFGNVRGSNLSATPNIQEPYMDFRHNTMVPGQSTQFGGNGQNTPPITVNITAMDGADVHRVLTNNPDALASAMTLAVNSGRAGDFTDAAARQMGLR